MFGINENINLYLTSVIGSLTIILVFMFSYLLFRKDKYALISAFLFAIGITHISWSRSSVSNIIGLFLMLSIFILQLTYANSRNTKLNYPIAFIFAYLIQTRLEYLATLPLIVLIYVSFVKDITKEIKKRDFFLPWLLVVPTLIFYIAQVNGILLNIANPYIAKTFMQLFIEHLKFFVLGRYQPMILYLFLAIGLVYGIIKHRKETLSIIMIYFLMLFFYVFYSSYFRVPVWSRFYLLNIVCINLIQGIGVYVVYKAIINIIKSTKIRKVFSLIVIIFLIIIIFKPSYRMIENGSVIRDYQVASIKIPEMAKSVLGKDCVIVASKFGELMFSSGTLFKTILIPDMIISIRSESYNSDKKPSCILYYEGTACKSPVKEGLSVLQCKMMREEFQLKPLRTKNYDFGENLYRIKI